MRKTLRFCGALGGLFAPLLLQHCHDNATVCEPVTQADGTVQQTCYEIGDFGKSTLAQTSTEPPGANCPNGGKRVDTGFDENDNNILDPAEVDVSAYICDGDPGPTGPVGTDGAPALTQTTPVDPGSDCAIGGLKVEYGVDADRDGELDADEVEGARYVCGVSGATGAAGDDGDNGTDGTDGISAHRTLVEVSELDPGDPCIAGGVVIESGLDDGEGQEQQLGAGPSPEPDNGQLEPDEVDQSTVVCNGDSGDDGEAGPTGVQGIPGLQGATGDFGPTGVLGVLGIPGPTGATGDVGPTGATGATGEPGQPGATGSPGITPGPGFIPFASDSPVVLTMVNGDADDVAIVGFGSGAVVDLLVGPTTVIDLSGASAPNFAFVVPQDSTVSSISASFTVTSPFVSVGGDSILAAALFSDTTNSGVFSFVQSSLVFLGPGSAPTPISSADPGDVFSGTTSVPLDVTGGTRLMLVVILDAIAPSGSNTITGTISGGLQFE